MGEESKVSVLDIVAQHLAANKDVFYWDATELITSLLSEEISSEDFYGAYNLILRHNKVQLERVKEENASLRKLKAHYDNLLSSTPSPIKIETEKSVEVEIPIISPDKPDVSKYLNKILNIEDVSEIDDILPDINEPNHNILIKTIIIKLKRELVATRNLLAEALDPDDTSMLLNQLTLLVDSINYIINANKEEIEQEEPDVEESNTIWYLTSNWGGSQGCYFLNDLKKRIPSDYYQMFSDMLEKLRRGYRKGDANITGFEELEDLKGIMKVKHGAARLYFMPLSKGNIVIIAAHIKKEMKSKRLREFLANRKEVYMSQESMIKNSLDNESFIASQQLIDNDVLELLPEPTKNRGVTYD